MKESLIRSPAQKSPYYGRYLIFTFGQSIRWTAAATDSNRYLLLR
jgi:hypothetical protein